LVIGCGNYPALQLKDASEPARAACALVAEGRTLKGKNAAKEPNGFPQTADDLAVLLVHRHARKHTRQRSWQETARMLE
jgi:hypothetical protein